MTLIDYDGSLHSDFISLKLSFSDWLCPIITKYKNIKRDSYLYDKLDNALKHDSFLLSKNNQPVVSDLKD